MMTINRTQQKMIRKQAQDTGAIVDMPDRLALPSRYPYENALSIIENPTAYIFPVVPLAVPDLHFENGKLYWQDIAVSAIEPKTFCNKRPEAVRKIDTPLLYALYSSIPRGLATWAHQNVMPAYFIYDHAKHGKASGVCTSCEQKATLTGVKYKAKGVCPHCGRELTMKPKGRIGKLYDRETFQVLQRTRTGELAVRIMKATCAYYGDHPGTAVYESTRQFVSLDQSGAVHYDRYYYAYSSERWKQGDRPAMFPYQYSFEGDTCGHVYCENLPKVLSGTPWQYCPIQTFYEHSHEPMQMYPFLIAHLEHPKLEHLVKVGFYDLVSDLTYRSSYGLKLDESQNRTHHILGVGAEDVDFLRGLDVNLSALKIFQGYCSRNLKDRQHLLAWQLEHKVELNVGAALEYMTAHKFICALVGQNNLCR